MNNAQGLLSPSKQIALERNEHWLAIYRSLLFAFGAALPIALLYYRSLGLSISQVFYTQVISAGAMVLFDVPCGYLADKVQRKLTLVLSTLCLFVSAILITRCNTFLEISLSQLLVALGYCLAFGADQALLYESLFALGQKDRFQRAWGSYRLYEGLAACVFAGVGGYLAKNGYRYPFYLAAVCFAINFFISLNFVEPTRSASEDAARKVGLSDLLGVGKKCLVEDQNVRWLLVYPALLVGLAQTALWMYPPHWLEIGINPVYFGWILALYNLVAGVSGILSEYLDRRLGLRGTSMLFAVALFLSYALAGQVVAVWAFCFALLQQFVRGTSGVYYATRLNHLVDSSRRATITSINGMIVRVLYMLCLIFIGSLMDAFGVIACQNIMAAVVLICCGAGLFMRPEG